MSDIKSLFNMQSMMFLMILTGGFFRRKNLLTPEGRKSLNSLVINLILPCNIFYAFSSADLSLLHSLTKVLIMTTALQTAWYLLSRMLWKKTDAHKRGIMRYAFQFSNCGFLGNPIIEGLYGSKGLVYASVYMIPIRIAMWSVGLQSFRSSDGGYGRAVKKALTHPCIIVTLLGILWMFYPIRLPEFFMNTINGFNGCLTPFTMLIIGSIMAEVNLKEMFCKEIYVITFLRLAVIPLTVLGICYLLNLEPLVTEVITVLLAMPVASTAAILASQYDSDAAFASNAVVFSTILSLVTIPLFSLLVELIFA